MGSAAAEVVVALNVACSVPKLAVAFALPRRAADVEAVAVATSTTARPELTA